MAARSSFRVGRLVKMATGVGVTFVAAQFSWGSERWYTEVVMPTVHRLFDAETGHKLALRQAAYRLTPYFGANHREYTALRCDFLGLALKNPIGLAAGFDKNGEAIAGLETCGLGFVEIGTVTPLPQPGNEAPRVFRLIEDRALINRYGFNNDGVGAVSARVKANHRVGVSGAIGSHERRVPLGVNIGKNKSSVEAAPDYEVCTNYFTTIADYVVVNVSSPNTPGLRSLQSRGELEKVGPSQFQILSTVQAGMRRHAPDGTHRARLLLKITCDLSASERSDIAKVVMNKRFGVDALIISNTTVERPDSLSSEHRDETGGLSGPPLREASTQCIADMYRLTNGTVPIVGCGGVESGADAYAKIRAGASVVQLYSALVFYGWPVIGRIKRELNELLLSDGYTTVAAAIGADQSLPAVRSSSVFNAASSSADASPWWRLW